MRPGPYLKILLIILILLLGTSLYAVDRAFYYRDLYYGSPPKVKIEKQSNTIYGRFDPDRSTAYTCTTQKVVANVGMVCSSPDNNTVINCTVSGNLSEYFC